MRQDHHPEDPRVSVAQKLLSLVPSSWYGMQEVEVIVGK